MGRAHSTGEGQPDARCRLKIRTLAQPACPVGGSTAGICTPLGFQIYPRNTSPAPIYRNEELILLQAEACTSSATPQVRWRTSTSFGGDRAASPPMPAPCRSR